MSKIIIVGNPNSGKTTLFNNLTGSHNRVGNWHGVTTDVAEKECKRLKKQIVDLPGIYSLKGFSQEEKTACDYLNQNKNEIVLNLIDASCLERGLQLTNELIQKGVKPVLVVNKTRAISDKVFDNIEERTGLPTFYVDVRNKKQLSELIELLSKEPNKIVDKFVQMIDVNGVVKFIDEINFNITKLDKLFLSDIYAIPAFLVIVGIIFYLTFGPLGKYLSTLFSTNLNIAFEFIINTIATNFGRGWFLTFLQEGLFTGVGSVLCFVPQIFILTFTFNYLELSGYLSRIAFIFDAMLKKIGLTGKAVFSLIMGFGCTTSAICTTKGLDNKSLQRRAIYGLGYISCSAKLPVMSLLISLFFTKNTALYVFLFYLLGFILALFVTFLLSIGQPKKDNLILEVPRLVMPHFSTTLKTTVHETYKFVGRIFTTVVSFSILLWILQSFDFRLRYVGVCGEESILYNICKPITLLFKPLGFSIGMVVALIVGIVAKELVITTFAILNGVQASTLPASLIDPLSGVYFTLPTAVAFILFMLVYSPCVAALSTIKKETDKKQMWKVLFSQILVAYVLALIGRFLTISILEGNILKIIGILILIATITIFVLQFFIRRNKGCRLCNDCKNLQGKTRKVS